MYSNNLYLSRLLLYTTVIMNKLIKSYLPALLVILFFFVSCGKDPITPIPIPVEPEKPTPPIVVPQDSGFKREVTFSNYIEYRTGNYPLIITIPHGGKTVVSGFPTRTKENCPDPNFTTVLDKNTYELGCMIDSMVFVQTGRRPFLVYCSLKRTHIDMNRSLQYAVPNSDVELTGIYNYFYDKIMSAKKTIADSGYTTGLLIDIHGHSHQKQRVELGYQLSGATLGMTDAALNSQNYASKSSIYYLALHNKKNIDFAQVMRGTYSFGTLLFANGVDCIPRVGLLSPGDDPYFSGGNITNMNGSGKGGTVNAIQMEFCSSYRETADERERVAKAIAKAVEEYKNALW